MEFLFSAIMILFLFPIFVMILQANLYLVEKAIFLDNPDYMI